MRGSNALTLLKSLRRIKRACTEFTVGTSSLILNGLSERAGSAGAQEHSVKLHRLHPITPTTLMLSPSNTKNCPISSRLPPASPRWRPRSGALCPLSISPDLDARGTARGRSPGLYRLRLWDDFVALAYECQFIHVNHQALDWRGS
jgi:hypothetical protein